MNEIEQVLDFWFGACAADGALDPVKRKMWFTKGRHYDAEIREKFGALHERASRGEFKREWAGAPRGRIALIVVLDQFSRHIHRGTPLAFAQDPAAQRLAVDGIERGADRALAPAGRAFFYLPLEHAEGAAMQELCVQSFERLVAEVAPDYRKDYESLLDYARRHRDIIARYGRFPHRNALLGRASTPAEIEFLKEPGSSFQKE